MANSIFRVGIKSDPTKEPVEHLVRAANARQAQDHVTAGTITVEKAEPEDVYRLAKAGVKLQDATGEQPAPTGKAAK